MNIKFQSNVTKQLSKLPIETKSSAIKTITDDIIRSLTRLEDVNHQVWFYQYLSLLSVKTAVNEIIFQSDGRLLWI